MKESLTRRITRCSASGCEQKDDLLAAEGRLTITVNGVHVVSIFCTPTMVRELAVGYVMTGGVADGVCTERLSIVYGEEGASVEIHAEGEVRLEGGTVASGCSGGVVFERKHMERTRDGSFKFEAATVRSLMKSMLGRQGLSNATGCAHSAAMAHDDEILFFAEDIGRHNAVDKVIGAAIIDGTELEGKWVLSSGRLSSDMVSKCSGWGIPLLVSRGAPTARAVRLAEDAGITVVGFVRGARFNIYTYPERITF